MSKTNSKHYQLCAVAANWLRNNITNPHKYVAVELSTYHLEMPDVWGVNGCASSIIEVKTSRADFLSDLKKPWRTGEHRPMGNFRWYLLPEGVVDISEVPDGWGVLRHNGEQITAIERLAVFQDDADNTGDVAFLCSIMRREGINPKLFNYRKK